MVLPMVGLVLLKLVNNRDDLLNTYPQANLTWATPTKISFLGDPRLCEVES